MLQGILTEYLPVRARELITSGKCVFGEIGMVEPNAWTIAGFPDNTYAITLTSGLMDGVYAVCRTIAATTTRGQNGSFFEASLTPEQAINELAAVLHQWKTETLWEGDNLKSPPFLLHSEQGYWAEVLATNVELFTLAHEVFHADLLNDPQPLPDMLSVGPAELIADQFALGVMVNAGAKRGYANCYAASVFYFRLLEALAAVGFPQKPNYPAPAERRAALEMAMSGMFVQDAATYEKVQKVIAMHEPFMVGAVAVIKQLQAAQNEALRDYLVMELFTVIDQLKYGRADAEPVRQLQEANSEVQQATLEIVSAIHLKPNRKALQALADLLSGFPRAILLERLALSENATA